MNVRTILIAASAALFLSLSLSVAAQTAPEGAAAAQAAATTAPQVLSLAKARELALAASPSLKKLGLAADASLLAQKRQALSLLPSLSASAQGGAGLSAGTASGASASLSASAGVGAKATIFDGGAGALKLAIAKLSTSKARAEAQAAVAAVSSSADSASFALLMAQASLEAAQENADSCADNLKVAQAKFDVGAATQLDLLAAQSSAQSSQTALSQARSSLSTCRAKFASLTGVSGAFELEKVDFSAYGPLISAFASLGDDQVASLASSLFAKAKEANPDLLGASLSAETAAKEASLAKAAYLPSVSAGLDQGFSLSKAGLSSSTSLSLSASLSLDFWLTALDVSTARNSAEQALLAKAISEDAVSGEIQAQAYACVSQAQSVLSSQKAADYAASLYQKTLELYTLSASGISDLSSARAQESENRSALIKAQYGFLSCLSTLRDLSGLASDAELLAALGK